MGRKLIKQPDGRYCLFSTVVDNFIVVDATKKEILNFLLEEKKEIIINSTNAMFIMLDLVSDTKEYKEALEIIKEVHGG